MPGKLVALLRGRTALLERDSLQPGGRAALPGRRASRASERFLEILTRRGHQRAGSPAQRGPDRRRLRPIAAFATGLGTRGLVQVTL